MFQEKFTLLNLTIGVFKLLVLRIWNYFRGYLIFRLEGLNLERVLNLAMSKKLYIWDIQRINYTTIEVKIGLNDFRIFEEILTNTGCKGSIHIKRGWPFFVSKLKKRKMILGGFFISILLIVIFTSFIWTVNINCSNYILEKDVLIYLNKIGVHPGIFKYNLNRKQIQNNILVNYDRIAWVGVEIKGTKIIIDIIEKDKQPSKIKNQIPCDIVSNKKAVIEKIIPENGDAMVEKGDVVKPNQILISGTIKRDSIILRYVHAKGIVYGRTIYEKTDKFTLNKTIGVKTGNKYCRKVIKFGNTSITIGSKNIPFEKYILETKNKSFFKWRNLKDLVEIVSEDYFEINEKKIDLQLDEIKNSLEDKLLVELMNEIPTNVEIVKKYMTYEENDDFILGKLTIEVIEPIGVEKKVEVSDDIEINKNENIND